MARANIDFTKIRIHDKSQNNGFEELCVQLFRGEHGSIESVNRVDGAGGDGGVEAFIINEQGVHGMQAKYWCDRLKAPQWNQLKKSVKAALLNHPALYRYDVMVPLDRSPAEITKWNELCEDWKTEATATGIKHDVAFVWIGKSEMQDLLLSEKYKQKKSYWFDYIDFGIDQLKNLNRAMISCIDLRYTPDHHVRTSIQDVLAAFCDMALFLDVFKPSAEQFVFQWNSFDGADSVKTFFKEDDEIKCRFESLSMKADALIEGINNGNIEGSIHELIIATESLQEEIRKSEYALDREDSKHREKHETPHWQGTSYSGVIRELRKVEAAASDLHALLRKHASLDYQFLLVVGDAGTGKSHLFAKQVEILNSENRVVSFYLGEQFHEGDSIENQIVGLSLFSGSFHEYLGFLNEEAEIQGNRAVIIIDGINEGDNRRIWKRHLLRLTAIISEYESVDLVISCRRDFSKLCLPKKIAEGNSGEWTQLLHRGFEDNLFEAVTQYFKGYNVETEHLPPVIPEFKNPLFLKTVCEAYADSKLEVGELTLKGIMDRRVEVLCDKIEDAIDCSPSETQECLMLLANDMMNSSGLSITLAVAQRTCKSVFNVAEQSKSLFSQLRSNGLLVEFIDYQTNTEMVRFPYERFSNYFVVEQLLKEVKTADQFKEWWVEKFQESYNDWHWKRENRGVLSMLAILAPERFNIELCDVVDCEEYDTLQLELLAESLVWRKSLCPSSADWFDQVKDHDTDYISNLWLDAIFRLCSIPQHPFNGKFLHEHLLSMTLADRELEWTIRLSHFEEDNFGARGSLGELLDWADYNRELLSEEQAELLSLVLLWICSSTNKALREEATSVAIRILKGKARVATRLVEHFSKCNDPYVTERVFAVVSAVATVECDSVALLKLAEAVYNHVFYSDVVSPNILLRHYARSVIEIAFYRGILTDEDMIQSARPPYKTDFPEILTEKEYKEYGDDYTSPYSTIMSSLKPDTKGGYGDFGRYEMQYSIQKFSSILLGVEANKEDLKKLYSVVEASRWIFQRVLEFGWTPELFKDYESRVFTADRSPPKIERISKKYQWIGLYEFCGYLSDHYQMANDWSEYPTYDRPAQLSIIGTDPCLAYCQNHDSKIKAQKIQDQCSDPYSDKEAVENRKSWVDTPDLGSFTPLILGNTQGESILLSGNFYWNEKLPFAQEVKEKGSLKMWAHLRSYLVKKTDKQSLLKKLRSMHFYGNGISLNSLDDINLGEYPWSDSCNELRDMCEGQSSWLRGVTIDLNSTACRYRSGDVYGILPSPQLCDMLKVQWTGERFDFAVDGEVMFESVSANEWSQPEVALINKESLYAALEENEMDVVWCLVAERGCWDGSKHITGSESEYSYIYSFNEGELIEEQVKHCIQSIP